MYSSISIQEQSLDLLGTFPTMLIVSIVAEIKIYPNFYQWSI